MSSRFRAAVGTVAAALALWVGWGLYVTRSTEQVPSETVDRLDGVEIRHYPQTVLVETTAPSASAAFRRLFGYISGENEGSEGVEMTAPVETDGATVGMTAPVRTGTDVSTTPVRTDGDDGESGSVRMAFYLPASYTPATAPVPTDPSVRLVVDPPRTAAVREFGWYATEGRVAREREALFETLADRGIETRGDPTLLQYNDPWTPPFMRRNEVEVTVDERSFPSGGET
ncbi:SOUL family heme-binding protein [Haloarcula nitratireducens]|uniref:Heme-binding protein n=1 Tax=Haloarcula nitratireducens TaxID=2487749 RepID=A0AAW4PDS1_9EURY|nr:heme-binding protein [Halomicroarcula nitratireducens]MBX0295595.1 heme-binding protein [Halomicroarcula nitratireducens]